MAVALATSPQPASAKPRFLDFGSDQTGALGSATTRLERLGARFGLEVQMPAMPVEPAGRAFVADLAIAKQERALLPWPQPNFVVGNPGAPTVRVASVANTDVLKLQGLTAGYALVKGQYLSIIVAGRRYLHFVRAAIAAPAGTCDVQIFPRFRKGIPVGAVVEIAVPMIEGFLEGDETTWDLEGTRTVAPSFNITEAE